MGINSTIRQVGRAAAGGPRPRPSQGLSHKGERARTEGHLRGASPFVRASMALQPFKSLRAKTVM